jgi:hypothetical protein
MAVLSKHHIGLAALLVVGTLTACSEFKYLKTVKPALKAEEKATSCTSTKALESYDLAGAELCKAETSEQEETTRKACGYGPGVASSGNNSDGKTQLEIVLKEGPIQLKKSESYIFSAADDCIKTKIQLQAASGVDYVIQIAESLKKLKGFEEFYKDGRLGSKKVLCSLTNSGAEDLTLEKGAVLKSKFVYQNQKIKATALDQYAKVMNATTLVRLQRGSDELTVYCYSDVNGDSLAESSLAQMLGIFSVEEVAADAKVEEKKVEVEKEEPIEEYN